MSARIGPNPSGLCQCGCGQPTPLAPQTHRARGWVNGEPLRFVHGHHARKHPVLPEPNPGGFCLCGCGNRTALARHSVHDRGWVKGRPLPYLHGHGGNRDRARDYEVAPSGCWIWQRGVDKDGYGATRRDSERRAHRWYYLQVVGPIPEGQEVHHTCEVKLCVNPAHLEPLTSAEHKRRHAKVA